MSNEQGAAESLKIGIQRTIKQVEREFGVYVSTYENSAKPGPGGDHAVVAFAAGVWPAAMRIIETERDSKAIG